MEKNPHAVALGKIGGNRNTEAQRRARSANARIALKALWGRPRPPTSEARAAKTRSILHRTKTRDEMRAVAHAMAMEALKRGYEVEEGENTKSKKPNYQVDIEGTGAAKGASVTIYVPEGEPLILGDLGGRKDDLSAIIRAGETPTRTKVQMVLDVMMKVAVGQKVWKSVKMEEPGLVLTGGGYDFKLSVHRTHALGDCGVHLSDPRNLSPYGPSGKPRRGDEWDKALRDVERAGRTACDRLKP